MGNENTDVLRRIALLQSELETLKATLTSRAKASAASPDLDGWLRQLDEDDDSKELVGVSPETKERAEKLFEGLLQKRRVISYAKAYELLFGEAPSPFRNAIHVPRVLEVAVRTTPRNFDGIEIRLDSLIVSIRGREPGPGHFRTAPYTLIEWNNVFGSWTLIR